MGGLGLAARGLGLDGDAGQAPVEPAGEGPGAAAEELEHGGQEDHADDDRVEEDRGREAEAEELEDSGPADREGAEDGDHDRGGRGDHPPGAGESLAYGGACVTER